MKHVWALLIKFLAIGTVLFSLFSLFLTASFGEILFMTVATTALAYAIGDLYLLRKFGNTIGTIGDFALSFGVIWFLSIYFIGDSRGVFWMSLTAATTIAAIEILFHVYLLKRVFTDSDEATPVPGVYREDRLMTEFSEEFEVDRAKEEAKESEEENQQR